ncbi:flagellar biosynthesis protein FlhF [Lentibacillus halodurans]|uniref:Flagellar biosynthesis protein FlhF n=1 Tax=Lentibacillus halodurans TaxID=237679 RepID=A0A1I0VN79_9BACI|nr:flagellar biosynthesis protein FlhF [Lentibacillus halodurans]SFA77320.1 flagellar biosynthesis protein FlhF [Lentibacillus halodurans]
MKVKKFVAPTMPEAMNHVRKELGLEAVILNSKVVFKGGFLGLFKKRNIEVVAALDPQPKPVKREKEPVKQTPSHKMPVIDSPVLNEIKQLRKMVEVQTVNNADYPVDYQIIYHDLLDQEVDEDLAKSLLDDVGRNHENTDGVMPDRDTILQDVKHEIENRLSALNFEGLPANNKLIQFVGPTGAGKTTTIAKVAASSMMNDGKQVALITADTYRIAAVEQLKTYANILNIPLEVVYNPSDYKAAVDKFASYDLILVDTAGRNFRDEKYVRDLEKTITFNRNVETCLVLSLTAKTSDIMKIYDQFQHLPIQNVIFTKVDETRQYGSILNIALKHKLGIAFLTNGQDVPDDIMKPNAQMISELIAGEQNDS